MLAIILGHLVFGLVAAIDRNSINRNLALRPRPLCRYLGKQIDALDPFEINDPNETISY